MISNIRHYYKQYLAPNKNFYLEVKNQSSFFLNIILYYMLKGKKITKPTTVFAPGKTQRIVFPDDSSDLNFDVYNCYFDPPYLICNNNIPNHTSSCFKVITNQQGYTQCIQC